jgi:hypothetical protein
VALSFSITLARLTEPPIGKACGLTGATRDSRLCPLVRRRRSAGLLPGILLPAVRVVLLLARLLARVLWALFAYRRCDLFGECFDCLKKLVQRTVVSVFLCGRLRTCRGWLLRRRCRDLLLCHLLRCLCVLSGLLIVLCRRLLAHDPLPFTPCLGGRRMRSPDRRGRGSGLGTPLRLPGYASGFLVRKSREHQNGHQEKPTHRH